MGQLIAKIITNPKVVGKVVPASVINAAVKNAGTIITKIIFKC
jgi:phospholipid N-methyltransferase